MGVPLKPLVSAEAVSLKYLHQKVVAIDATNLLCQVLYNPSQRRGTDQRLYTDRTFRVISHLYGMLYKAINFYKHKALPIFVFDGQPSRLKRIISKRQGHDYRVLSEWYQMAMASQNYQKAKNIAYRADFIWSTCLKESKALLTSCGVPVVTAPSEAEAQCAALVKEGSADVMVSTDYDALLYGCPTTLHHLTFSTRYKVNGRWRTRKSPLSVLHLRQFLETHRLSLPELIDLSLLVGNDYTPGVTGIGPKTAVRLLHKYPDILEMRDQLGGEYDFSAITPATVRKIRKLFLFPEVHVDLSNLSWEMPTPGGIVSLLCNDHFLNCDRVNTAIERLVKYYKRNMRA